MFGFRKTRTFAVLEISESAYDEIASKLREAGYDHAFVSGAIDMHGITLTRGAEPAQASHPAHRPIAPNAKQQKREPKR